MGTVIFNFIASIQLGLLIVLGLATLYIFIFAFAGLFYKQAETVASKRNRKIAVFIPGYKEDEVIVAVARQALLQDYPMECFDVIVIADSFEPATISALQTFPIQLIEVSFEKSTKSKALNSAMEQITGVYDIAVILDADNVMEKDFLNKINNTFERGFIAVQGHRTAKNSNTNLAILDAASEEINNHIFRKGHRVLGLSSAIIGSGMAFQYGYFKTMMAGVKAVGGFDKEIELKTLKAGIKIEYVDDALVYDEKVQKAEVFSNQRRRWLSAQFHYFRKDFLHSVGDLIFKGNIDYFDKALQFIQPPRILLLGAILIFTPFFIFLNKLDASLDFLSVWWIILLVICIFTFLFSIPRTFYNAQTAKALLSLPKGMALMLMSLLKIKGANKQFIHTQHSSTFKEAGK
jgi:cellulose synthase/poly-beta-1,6-N-acetylglucosamine synthase-like glycosyltransferase